MEENASWESNSRLASKANSLLLRNPQNHYRAYKCRNQKSAHFYYPIKKFKLKNNK
jgi:hypothetical protein